MAKQIPRLQQRRLCEHDGRDGSETWITSNWMKGLKVAPCPAVYIARLMFCSCVRDVLLNHVSQGVLVASSQNAMHAIIFRCLGSGGIAVTIGKVVNRHQMDSRNLQ